MKYLSSPYLKENQQLVALLILTGNVASTPSGAAVIFCRAVEERDELKHLLHPSTTREKFRAPLGTLAR